jgi:hypothetical protein
MRVYEALLAGCTLAACILATPTVARTQSLSQPDDWEVRAERFVAMPPGFHITTSPFVLFYHPDARAEGAFEVVTEGFLFGGDSPNAYGLFVGGRNLGADDAAWTSFEIGHDGTWVVRSREFRGDALGFVVEDLAGPEPGPVAVPDDETTAKNVLAVVARPDSVEFRLNGETVATLPRAELTVDGVVGFRVGADLNLHLVSLTINSGDETTEWAPAPAESSEEGGA